MILTIFSYYFVVLLRICLQIKILYYLMWVAGNDFETQCKGIVVIIWPVSEIAITHLRNHNKEVLVRTQKKQLEGACARVCAFHFCVPPNPFFQVLRSVFAMTLDKKMRSRLKFHTGMCHDFVCERKRNNRGEEYPLIFC